MIGNSGGIVSSYLYPLSDGPHFCKNVSYKTEYEDPNIFNYLDFGNIFNLCCAAIGAVVSVITSYLLWRQNCKLDRDYQEFGNEQEQVQFRYFY